MSPSRIQAPAPDGLGQERRERILDERTRELALRRRIRKAAPEGALYLVCTVGRNVFGLPLTCVARALPAQACTPAPRASPELLGLFGHEGRTVAAVDLGVALGVSDPRPGITAAGCFVLTRQEEPRTALRVDAADAVVRLAPSQRPEALGREAGAGFITAYADLPSSAVPTVVALLDVDKLLRTLSQSSSHPGV
ncbi:chemotaxis protein CheW [Alsobacter sp. KACC 23698]|uniref:Chemotaxis protein CheW n=1 Tax=Alsobacter sp. KACC 23698 TaxID=3149229 RepID=A0AAU7JFN3_9HYPH